jgi:hypothetical protein
MRRNWALAGAGRVDQRSLRSLACLVFVVCLSVAFWAGAAWVANVLIRLISVHAY